MKEQKVFTQFHKKTKRDYVGRMMNGKIHCMSKARKFEGEDYRVVGAGYRCQGRLKTNIKSKYSLDNPEDVKKLFGV